MGVSNSKPHPVETKWFPDFEASLPSLEGKTVAITGTTSGTGYIVARTAARKNADTILLLNRPSERAQKAEADLKAEANANTNTKTTKIISIDCDLQDLESVKKAAATIKGKVKAIDVLCNNAGVMALEDKATKDGYDVQMQTNHISHFMLTKELYPLLQKAKELNGSARVTNHTSEARHGKKLEAEYFGKNGGNLGGDGSSMLFGGARWVRYQQSKLANSVFTKALADKFGDNGIVAACAHPGLAATNLQLTTASTGGMGSGMWIMRMSQSQEDGAMPIVAACFDTATKNGSFWAPSGMGQFTGPAKQIKWDKKSEDADCINVLWKTSEEACGAFGI
jgi:NAD(P)-dependent dehydrogenase (short-subunit alcohol dehydrogenase family)